MKIEILENFDLLEREPEKFRLDPFQENVLFNLYLEIPVRSSLYMLSPSLSIIYPEQNMEVEDEVEKREETLNRIKRLILETLIKYTAIIEANSYFIEQNDFLLLCRFAEQIGTWGYRLKFYTHNVREIIPNYDDKLYVGHDFLSLSGERDYFGLNDSIPYLDKEFEHIRDKAEEFNLFSPFVRNYLVEMGELVGETLLVWENKKTEVNIDKTSIRRLSKAILNFTEVKHILVELHDEIREFEYRLRKGDEGENHFSRYITKFRKDVVNILHFVNMKLLSRIQFRINSTPE